MKTLLTLLAVVAVASAADSVLVFNELHYHPANEAAQTEWIELRSLQAVDVDISGWRIDGGVDFTFPAGTIMPGHGYLVVAAVPGQIAGAIGPFTGLLDNGGETLRLRNRNGRIMDELSYDDEGEWPVAADGGGVTLARRLASAAEGAGNWSASIDAGGTPGALNFLPVGSPNIRTRAVAVGDTWRFLDDGTTPAANWKLAGFNDAAWKTGATLITGGGGALAQARPSDFPSGLIGYWAFDEMSGTTADNSVAGQPDGTMANGAVFFTDPMRGKVASFDGTDDRMEVLDGAAPSLTFLPQMTAANDFTMAAWVWSSTVSSAADQASAVILGNRSRGPAGENASPVEFMKMSPTQLLYQRNGAAENLDYADLATSAWTHMCIVKRGLNFDYYRNGAFLVTRTITTGLTNVMPFYVGGDRRQTSPLNEHFQGRVDDVGLWARALSAGEIASLGTGFGIAPSVMPVPPEQTTNAVTGPEPRHFRKAFTFTGAPARTTIELWPVADDGAIVYLNGTEIWRSNVPVTSEVGQAAFTPTPILLPGTALVTGANVLSAEVHQFPGGNTDLVFGAELITDEAAPLPPDANPTLVLSEISAASDAGFFIELQNKSAAAINTAGWVLTTSAGASIALPSQVVAAGGYASFTAASLGLAPADGLRVNLFAPGGTEFHDARAITNRHSGLTGDGRWGHPDGATPGAANVFTVSDAIVINEIFYNAVNNGAEQWVELHNKSASPVSIAGWRFSEGISFDFPVGATIAAGGFVVVAWDATAFALLHPGVTALGTFSGSLSGSGETITLRDANDNVADQVTYYDGGRWSQWADGGGSSLELIDPDADNSRGEAWDASDESSKSTWQNVSYGGLATNTPANNPATWHEFVFGLLNNGEMLIDDISVTTGATQLIQNGNFSAGNANFWRIIGTHSGSVVPDPIAPANNVLKVVATAETEHMHNHATTTLKNGAAFHTIVDGGTYTISFRAKWLRGSNALHSRLYTNRLPRKTLLNRPATGGTPGVVNSRFVANIGPTFDALNHSPAVPAASALATVSVRVADADGIASVQLFTSINGAAFTSSAMTTTGGGIYTGTVPGQSAGAVVQFYVRATDTPGAITFFPAGGPASRAMIQWADGRAMLTLASGAKPHNLRVIMPGADANQLYRHEFLMSNAAIPCTVILDESVIYYRAGVSLKSSEHGRFNINRVGYNIEFPPDGAFLGTHGGISVDRSGGTGAGQSEILLKQLTNLAGGMHAPEDDLIRLIPTVATGTGFQFDGSGMLGSAILSKTRLKRDYLDNQWENGGDGMMFKYERIYVLTQTINAATRVVDGAIVPENPKIPQDSTGPPGINVTNLGADSEIYRWHWLVESGRDTDDYVPIMNVTNAIGQAAGGTFNTLVDQHVDVNTWLRAHVPPILFGVTDNYLAPGGAGSQHNVMFYFPPGQKAVAFAWDCDFLNQGNSAATLIGGDVAKFIANPVWKRLYYGHMLDILNRSFNTATMTTWATHYSRFADNFAGMVGAYLTPRAAYAMNVINGTGGQTAPIPPVAFARTSGNNLTVATSFTTVSGNGWINVAEIRLQGSAEPLAVTWTGESTWSLQLPVSAGTNTYTLLAFNPQGAQVGSTTVTVTGSGGIFPAGPGNLVVSEIHYNPPGSADTTEFIELLNITGATLNLGGCHFDEELGQGITFTFATGTQIAPGARIIVARNRTAFLAAYPGVTAVQVATGGFEPTSLDNGGESLVLYAASGLEIFRFGYSDNLNPTDGAGRSMVRVLSTTAPSGATYEWRASTLDGGNPGTSDAAPFTGDPLADADLDGLRHLLEYTLGTSDAAPGAQSFTYTRDALGNITLTFAVTTNADDAILTIESTTSLTGAWGVATAGKTFDTTTGTQRTETWLVTPPSGATTFFLRLKATQR